MAVWAIADLHLSFGVPNKGMEIFGPRWKDHTARLQKSWFETVSPDDLVLIAGDISWAKKLDEALPDLDWIARLPGTKLMIKGNHDGWWGPISKVRRVLPPSCHVLQNDSFLWNDIAIAGSRLWDAPGLNFDSIIQLYDYPCVKEQEEAVEDDKVFIRELGRLEASLKSIPLTAKKRIVMTHYPPVGPYLEPTPASDLLEKYNIEHAVFGHLHSVKQDIPIFGTKAGITYHLVACDYLNNFHPLLLLND